LVNKRLSVAVYVSLGAKNNQSLCLFQTISGPHEEHMNEERKERTTYLKEKQRGRK
jgi:hypothetical protein